MSLPLKLLKINSPWQRVSPSLGTALSNHTLSDMLSMCRPGALVMVLGASTPLFQALFDNGVSILSGTHVVDEDAVLRTISRGAIFKQVEGVRLLTQTHPSH